MVIYHKYTTLSYRPIKKSSLSQLTWYCPLWYAISWPHGQQSYPYPQGFSLPPWAAASLTHNQGISLLLWAAGKNMSSKVKEHWPWSDSVVTKTIEIRSGEEHWRCWLYFTFIYYYYYYYYYMKDLGQG